MDNEQYIESGLSVGAVKYVDPNEMITEEEYNYIKNKVPELDGRVGVIEGEIEEINSSLDNMKKNIVDISDYKGNDIHEKLSNALDDIKKMQTYENELVRNVVIKFPSGSYKLNKQLFSNIEPKNIEFDFTNCNFIANTKDFPFAEIVLYRTRIVGGNWSGFDTVWKIKTNNIDHSKIIFTDNQFALCNTCIDLVGYNESRSTLLRIDNITSLKCKTTLKTYTDMCVINGGWITSLNDDSVIYNMGNTEINDVCFTPYAVTNNSAWIENFESPEDGDRSISINHCRFGAESGGKAYVIKNHAEYKWFNKQPTRIKIDNCMLYGNYAVYCVKMPSNIYIANSNGNGVNYLVGHDPSLNVKDIPTDICNIEFANITNYNSVSNLMEYFDDDFFYNCLTGNKGGFRKDLEFNILCNNGKAIIKTPITNYPSSDNAVTTNNDICNVCYLVTISGRISGNPAYACSSVYIISLSSYHNGKNLSVKTNYTKLHSTKGGTGNGYEFAINSVTFNDTGLDEINLYDVNKDTYLILDITNSDNKTNISLTSLTKNLRYTIF